MTDYRRHIFTITIVLVWFTIKSFTLKVVGSVGALYDLVLPLSRENPVVWNYEGSNLTMTSKESIYFGIIHIL